MTSGIPPFDSPKHHNRVSPKEPNPKNIGTDIVFKKRSGQQHQPNLENRSIKKADVQDKSLHKNTAVYHKATGKPEKNTAIDKIGDILKNPANRLIKISTIQGQVHLHFTEIASSIIKEYDTNKNEFFVLDVKTNMFIGSNKHSAINFRNATVSYANEIDHSIMKELLRDSHQFNFIFLADDEWSDFKNSLKNELEQIENLKKEDSSKPKHRETESEERSKHITQHDNQISKKDKRASFSPVLDKHKAKSTNSSNEKSKLEEKAKRNKEIEKNKAAIKKKEEEIEKQDQRVTVNKEQKEKRDSNYWRKNNPPQ